jgi:hypothetical protein
MVIDQHILDRLDQIIKNTTPGSPVNGQRYYNTVAIVDTPGVLKVEDTAQTTFYNSGTSNVIILGALFLPGQGIAFPGNAAEVDTTKYTYTFAGAGNNSLTIIQKMYVNAS